MDAETFKKLLPLEYAQKFLREQIRPDGRALLESRPIKIDKGGITSADGSSTVRMGASIAVCGIKCQVAMPDVARPKQGWLVPNVELGPMCASRFRPGPPNELTQCTSHQVNEALQGSIDLEQLCIEEGSAVWVLYVDVVFVSFAGNALDVSLLAIRAALEDLNIPIAKYDDGMVTATSERVPLKIKRPILSKSWSILSGSIILDPTDEEEDLSEGKVHVITDEASIVGVWKSGKAISPKELSRLIESALVK